MTTPNPFTHHINKGYKTHYFSKEVANQLIDSETFLNRKTAFQIAYDTGARAGEIITISGEHFDFDKEQMVLWDSKKKSWKIVPLSPQTIVAIKMYMKSTNIRAKLFKVTTKTLNNWLNGACTREGIIADLGTRIRWHSFRGTFIRCHMNLGDRWLMQVTGDSYQTILNYYSELTEDDLRKAKHKISV
ncbi:MAG: site-specific integrase [Candidatus Omnitrophica bacterium]|nr:site-specific integrase [Candidatus Omnitrophota bacterium]